MVNTRSVRTGNQTQPLGQVLAQLLARTNPGDPFINLFNPTQQPPVQQQDPKPVQHAPALSESQGQSHVAPAQQPLPDDLETYDGTKDADDHLHAFYSCMQAQNASDALMCKIFPSTLRGNARTWYHSLPRRSINSYTEMVSAFATKFSSRRLIRKTTSELMRVKQREGESLKNYMSRFNDAILEVNSFNQAVGIVAVIQGSQSHLCMKFPIPMGITTLRGNHEVARHCYITSVTRPQKGKDQTLETIPQQVHDNKQVMGVEIVDNRSEDETRATLVEDVEEVQIDGRDQNRKTQIGTHKHARDSNLGILAQTQHQSIEETSSPEATSLQGEEASACPKDYYPMPSIDKLVEATSGNERLSLLDAYSGYHQVPMALEDEEKTSFYAGDEIYCYVMMPFGLKNTGATYQKMVTIIFRAQIGKNLEVYVDDIVRRIGVNPKKIKAIAVMELPKSVKDIQRLMGRVAALHIFISKSADKCLPFFKIMRSTTQKDESSKQKKFEWNPECQVVFDELKSYLSSPSLLTKILQKPECSGRLIKWAVELREFEIAFQQRSTIRAQALANFIIECTPCQPSSNPESSKWTLYVDGISNNKGSRASALLVGLDGYRSEHALKFNFDATNNMAKYEALLLGLQLALELKVMAIRVYSDSQLVVNQVNLVCEADSLSKFTSDSSLSSRSIFVEVLDEPSFMKPRMMEISTDPNTPSWTDPIVSFLQDGSILEDKQEAMRLRKKTSRYTLVDGVLYKRSFSLPLLRCLNPYEAEYALRDVHEGVCGSHIGARTLAHKVLRQGYYWPNMYKDATHFWGLDLLGPFMKGVGGVTHLIVGVDYFTKWVEAQPLSTLTSKKVKDFVFSSIIYKYGILNQIVANNGTQFNCSSFREFCSSYGVKLQFTSVYHLESNGMVESVNKVILEGKKPRLEQHKAKWADELNNVLWAYRTTSRTTTSETPYHLAFGTEAVILIEIGVPSFRVTHFDEGRTGQLFQENLDLLAEVREEARLRTQGLKLVLTNWPQIGKALTQWPKCHIPVLISSKMLKGSDFLESRISTT
ncbi:hypothetical protein SLEP1_g45941 [Rubroshorea leprosula]|uniref:Integrase catalytic domain-containing protein n=1 Tax=Rubroshorea leprosula TaxID=152421 RepID=A0AAV5LMD8_9ROSI|nr:hypothetical protein SLEP1_g45941 [Rubroshorea leprosula]